MNYPVLWENDDLVAIEKPVGIATVFERKKETECLIQSLRDATGLPLMVVHRLDKDVSGVVVFAKHPDAHRTLNLQFDRREIHKSYTAIVHGVLPDEQGVIQKPIRQYGSGRMGVDEEKGQDSITRFILKRNNGTFSQVNLMPITGRRHQLRVHMYAMGYPIVGDPLYGDKSLQKGFPRLMLHAAHIEFSWKGTTLRIDSPIPAEFEQMMSAQ